MEVLLDRINKILKVIYNFYNRKHNLFMVAIQVALQGELLHNP